ncbi:GDSL-type esterase/lipase family protein [Aminipila terrae]|uniref:SGNH hydrolase-type esterase domain-containing protein n=1 Tax=Aminipila terrae TaxID=2697030 RepID=A0A6P1ML78_9FIRM|nr:GDSL-type esterase/lipase family protein [Aminipila terrae]QHI72818.1 hypothetical protein Ami3637_10730 [Aminipila terrae]
MIRIKNRKRFKIFIIISVVVLIVLVWCMIWINIEASEHGKRQDLTTNKNVASAVENVENTKTNKSVKEDKIKEKPEISEKNKDVKSGEKPNDTNKINTDKPMVTPEKLPGDQEYSIYNNTLIIGDSRIEGFKLYSGVKNASYFCMKAMTIDKIVEGKQVPMDGKSVSVYDMLDAANYDKVIVGVGLNELGWNHIETFLADYGKLIDSIKEKQPDAVIYLQAVLPVSKSKNDSDKVHNNAQIYWYNENIIKLASDKGVQFINPAAALVDGDGYLVSDATTDGIHLNSQYCKVWAQYLAGLIK